MRKPPIFHRPDFVTYIRILAGAFGCLPLHHDRGDDAERIDYILFDEVCDRHVEALVEVERRVEEEFAGAVGGKCVRVGALG